MCDITRRGFLAGGAAFLSGAAEAELMAHPAAAARPETAKVYRIAPDVYFHQGRLARDSATVCNNGWILFADYLLVIDANFPAGARQIIAQIRSLTDKPIRFALDTHHHGDHAYGNEVYVEKGAVPVAHTGVIAEMKRAETGYYGSTPGAWEKAAKNRDDVKESKFHPPTVLYSGELVFDDGQHRVEVIHLGVAHTHGDSLAWLPREKILFTGDVCVNEHYNFVGDGNVGEWIGTLAAAKKLGAETVCTGLGPRSVASVLEDQQAFFKELQEQVNTRMATRSPADAKDQIEPIRAALKANAQIARYVAVPGPGGGGFASQVEKVYNELTGNTLAEFMPERQLARQAHAHAHGQTLRG